MSFAIFYSFSGKIVFLYFLKNISGPFGTFYKIVFFNISGSQMSARRSKSLSCKMVEDILPILQESVHI